jgi:hypothetical protein
MHRDGWWWSCERLTNRKIKRTILWELLCGCL